MVQITGKYQHAGSSANFEEYVTALGTSADRAKELANDKSVITVSEAGGTWTIVGTAFGTDTTVTFKLGEPYDEKFSDEFILKNVTRREGDKLITTTLVDGVEKGSRTFEFTDDGFTMHLAGTSGTSASRTYKRI